MSVLIIAEHDHNSLHPATRSAINAASELSKNIIVLVVGYNCNPVATQASLVPLVNKIIYIDHVNYQYLDAANLTAVILNIINSNLNYYKYIICTATAFGKNVLPRLAACLDVEQISEITKIIAPDTFERFIYSGDAIQTVKLLCELKCLTVRVGYFVNPADNINNTANIESIDLLNNLINNNPINTNQIKFLEFIKSSQQLDLATAKIVVAGGRGVQSKSNFDLIEQLAKNLNAAVGATRTAVYAGFAPSEWQIGFSGKTITADVYIAIGISGAVQHVCGVKESKCIVAINIDENAPIFNIANYKLVGDLLKIVPELIAAFG